MAFALTGAMARGIDIAGPSQKRGIQQIVLRITGTTADVALDIGTAAGTFWTAAIANTTYGTLASNFLNNVMVPLSSQSTSLVAVKSAQLLDRVQIATPNGAGQYALAVGVLGPNLSFNAADGETAYYIVLEYELNDLIPPIVASYWPAS